MREFFSFAPGALEKIRYESIIDPDKLVAEPVFFVQFIPDKSITDPDKIDAEPEGFAGLSQTRRGAPSRR